ALDGAVAARGAEAFDQGLPVFQQPHDVAKTDLGRILGKGRTASATAPGLDNPAAGKLLHDLGQVVPRKTELLGQISGRKGRSRRACHAHQHAQPVIGEGCETHLRALSLNQYLKYLLADFRRIASRSVAVTRCRSTTARARQAALHRSGGPAGAVGGARPSWRPARARQAGKSPVEVRRPRPLPRVSRPNRALDTLSCGAWAARA